jgi:dipeptidyl aminopeptidase/acylaminoacyl peptidase
MRRRVSVSLIFAALSALAGPLSAAPETPRRPFSLADLERLRTVSDPQVSPDGRWVAYTVRRADAKDDKRDTDVWMTSLDGKETVRLTSRKESETTPRWSPDGRFLAFLSSRDDSNEESQLWLLPRGGGEAEKITDRKGGIEDYDWSPDGRRLVLVGEDPDPDKDEDSGDAAAKDKDKDKKAAKTKKPIVVDRFQFKRDVAGYLGKRRMHLYVLDLGSRKVEPLTSGEYDEKLPSWSPDGSAIAFVSKRGSDPDRTDNWDVFAVEPRPGAAPRAVTTYEGGDNDPEWGSRLAWSHDSRSIAYVQGGPDKLIYYGLHKLAIVPAAGGAPRILTPDLDRNVVNPAVAEDGATILFALEDDGSVNLASVPAAGGAVRRLVTGRRVVSDVSTAGGKTAILMSTPDSPAEVYAFDGAGEPRRLSAQNDALLSELKLGTVTETKFKSKDGTEIHGFLLTPPDYSAGKAYPTVLRIHGGPVGQFENTFSDEWQWLAANGYVVVAANPRGSSGRGQEFCKAIYADWGHRDAEDVVAAVDDAIAKGVADPNRLGVGGWSYGGILTNYVIAQDTRFRGATSGASISNILAGYGTDQYVREYEQELGPPWKNAEGWIKLSFPFLHADRVRTPTLFLCGTDDFNVPLLNSEQMYQALRSLNVPTQLVIYPGQHHGINKPSYVRDRLERYVAWYDKYVKAGGPPPAAAATTSSSKR